MGPGIEADTKFEFIGSNVDVAPTFLALAGIDASTVDPPMDGKSVAAQLIKTGAQDTPRVLNKRVPPSTAASVARELADAGATPWRDHHWVEYYSLGNVTRTGRKRAAWACLGVHSLVLHPDGKAIARRSRGRLDLEHVPRAPVRRQREARQHALCRVYRRGGLALPGRPLHRDVRPRQRCAAHERLRKLAAALCD